MTQGLVVYFYLKLYNFKSFATVHTCLFSPLLILTPSRVWFIHCVSLLFEFYDYY